MAEKIEPIIVSGSWFSDTYLADRDTFTQIFSLLLKYKNTFPFNRFRYADVIHNSSSTNKSKYWRKFDLDNPNDFINNLLSRESGESIRFTIATDSNYYVALEFHMRKGNQPTRAARNLIMLDIEASYFQESGSEICKARTATLISFCIEFIQLIKPSVCQIHLQSDDLEIANSLVNAPTQIGKIGIHYSKRLENASTECPISGVYWANFYSRTCLKVVNKDFFLQPPEGVVITDLGELGVFFLTAPDPLNPWDLKRRELWYECWKRLGLKPLPHRHLLQPWKGQGSWVKRLINRMSANKKND